MRTVLLVDDEQGILFILDAVLTDAGYRTVMAGNGKQALELFRTERPDVVLMDWMMPIMDGPTAARAMREIRPDVPLVLMTGADPQGALAQFDAFAAVLRKPFRTADITAAIAAADAGRAEPQA